MKRYHQAGRQMEKHFAEITVKSIVRTKNEEANCLAQLASNKQPLPQDVFVEVLTRRSVDANSEKIKKVISIHVEDWRAPIVAVLQGRVRDMSPAEKQGAAFACHY
ncbi:hypothetical protein U9M48_013401 [Paspalum notatum var. saurae]|uniref:RNase H type-1 domain-containing protein n=1 Tax=Paspalum notatum var. saurae TaxID=547442 RepID=A0AAQ3SZW3_PASNO